jgi:triphosphoribosyl-dephospho-CoA synthase
MNRSAEGPELTIGQCASLACLWEATTPKVGNVHRSADFENLRFSDFTTSAAAISPAMQQASQWGVGRCVLQAIQTTQLLVQTNTNLGTVLLLAPLAAISGESLQAAAVAEVLKGLTSDDANLVYEAIRVAKPGGMGKRDEMDIDGPAPDDLLAAMQVASQEDLVALQYVTDFALVFDVAEMIAQEVDAGRTLTDAIIHGQLRLLSQHPDSLIQRKCGREVALQATTRANAILELEAGSAPYYAALDDFDFWLRSDANRRNPGTTADLIAAGLFVLFRQQRLATPWR